MVERGDVYQGADDWERRDLTAIEMPVSVRETLVARARTMDPTAAHVLQVAAVASDVLDLEVLAPPPRSPSSRSRPPSPTASGCRSSSSAASPPRRRTPSGTR